MRASSSLRCSAGAHAEEADDDELSDDARAAFYAAEGCWSLSIVDLGPRRLEALRVLREHLQLAPPALTVFANGSSPVITGALVEVERIEDLLATAGATTRRESVPR